jgi:DNA-binding Lrp family transcriptional regulator
MSENANTNATPAASATPAAGTAAPDVVSKAAHDELAGRFGSTLQQLNEAKQKLSELTAKEEAAAKAKLTEQGEFQKLAEVEKAARAKAEQERDELAKRYEADTKRFQLGIAAKNAGINDVNDALALIDVSSLEMKDGKVSGIEDAIKKLTSEKPYLFGTAGAPRPHGDRAGGATLTKEALLKDYNLMVKLKTENPAEYERIMHGQ